MLVHMNYSDACVSVMLCYNRPQEISDGSDANFLVVAIGEVQ